MGQISLETANIGQSDSTEEPKLVRNFTVLQAWANGRIDTNNLDPAAGIRAAQLASAILDQAGINDGTIVRRGSVYIATEEGRTNSAYGLLATPDRIQGVVVPANAIVEVRYSALWRESSASGARAAIFIGANQLKTSALDGGAPVTTAAMCTLGSNGRYLPLFSDTLGLMTRAQNPSSDYSSEVTTGMTRGLRLGDPGFGVELGGSAVSVPGVSVDADTIGGGVCEIRNLAAGTYDFSVQFRHTTATVTAKERRLTVVVRATS